MVEEPLVTEIRRVLGAHGDPERAIGQQRYMKSEMPFRGITSAELTALLRPVLSEWGPTTRREWEASILQLWDGATFREERYAALAVARTRMARQWCDPAALPLFRHLIVTGAWWDFVDVIAAHLVGQSLAQHRDAVSLVMRAWARDEDLWVRRTAVLSQLRHKADTDRELLREVIEPNLADPSFWLRKSIGWALREFARTDPDWVLVAVDGWGNRLSNLSRREALKHLSADAAR
jgi:3-methyladenine DNA glycosylase AlkD